MAGLNRSINKYRFGGSEPPELPETSQCLFVRQTTLEKFNLQSATQLVILRRQTDLSNRLRTLYASLRLSNCLLFCLKSCNIEFSSLGFFDSECAAIFGHTKHRKVCKLGIAKHRKERSFRDSKLGGVLCGRVGRSVVGQVGRWAGRRQVDRRAGRQACKSSDVFPPEYTIYRNDRKVGTGGGVFTATKEGLITDAQLQLTTDCEIVWSKVMAWNKKDIYLCSFCMPHRNLNDINRLGDSLRQITQCKSGKHIILAGDFNFIDIDWEKMTNKNGAADREVQQALLDLSIEHGLTQVHSQPTRDMIMLDLVFTNNPSE